MPYNCQLYEKKEIYILFNDIFKKKKKFLQLYDIHYNVLSVSLNKNILFLFLLKMCLQMV